MSDEISRLETSFVRHSIYLTYQYVFLIFPLMPFDRTVTKHIVPIDIIKWLEILLDIDFS